MADPRTYRPASGTIPLDPGVYKFRDAHRRVIYVGKAKNLRARINSYFQDPAKLRPRVRQMVFTAESVEWTVVATEVEALQLEYTWIKRFDPHFNVMYRDDKTYPMLAVSTGESVPRVFIHRGPRHRGIRYFGPYIHGWAVRETLDLLIRVFPMRTCSKGVYNRHERLGRPCLLGYIDKCAAPCVGRVSPEEHREIVNGLISFLAGNTRPVIRDLTARMEQAAEDLEFERAARLRDDLEAIHAVMKKQAVVFRDDTDADVIAFATDELEAAVQIFHVRGGRIHGQRGWVVERADDREIPALMQHFLVQFYTDGVERAEMEAAEDAEIAAAVKRRDVGKHRLEPPRTLDAIPREILVQELPEEAAEVQELLAGLRGASLDLRVPQRGDKRALIETVERNAEEALRQHKIKRVGDLTARSAALQDIQEALGMEEAPLRIECTDISHIQGTDVVASLVVFEDGLPRKSDYRRYRIREAAGEGRSDDVASIAEITHRRFLHHHRDRRTVPDEETEAQTFADERGEETGVDGRRFAYPPNLFIVDGGAPQVNAAQRVFDELGIVDVVLVGLAKRLEEIWLPGEEDPVILPRNSQGLYLLQQIRDEAHRVAVTYHRQQRTRRMRSSELDGIPGLGAVRRAELVKHFGSVKKLKEAGVEEIAEVKGFGPKLAQTVHDALRPGNVGE